MTQAQKTAKAKFKQAIAYRQKSGVSLKEAFAHIYGKKKVVKKAVKKSAPKKKANKLGALPIGFKGKIYDIPFKIVNQYDIYNDVSAIMEDTDNGSRIVTFDGKGTPKVKAETIVSYINKISQSKPDKELYIRMLKFATNMQKEVKDYNSGIKKTIKKQPLKIVAPKKKAVIKKKVAIKKVAVTKKAVKKTNSIILDKRYQAKKPGKRTSKSGNVYYEYRDNRSDKGRLLGVKKPASIHKDTKSHNVNIRVMSGVDNSIFDQLQKIKKSEIFYNDIVSNLDKEYSYLKTQKGSQINSQKISNRKYHKKAKEILKELKEHTNQLKKHI
jgi:hypothetical protein